jgi:uncharacterized protein
MSSLQQPVSPMTPPVSKPAQRQATRGYRKTDFYRHARHVHSWLSAFAFLVLMFFSLTGLLLNHPEWFESDTGPEQLQQLRLSPAVLQRIAPLENPTDQVLAEVRGQSPLLGRLKSSERIDDEWMVRLEGPMGQTDLTLDIQTGQIDVVTSAATVVSTLNDLHRGKNVGSTWRWLIDISAVLILLLSLAGYILFFSLKKRLSTSLWLTGTSVFFILILFYFGAF